MLNGLVGDGILVAIAPSRQEVLQLGGYLVGGGELAVDVGQRGSHRVVLHVAVVPLLERSDKSRKLGIVRDLTVDLGQKLPTFLAQPSVGKISPVAALTLSNATTAASGYSVSAR